MKELAFRITADDRSAPVGLVLRPHGLVAFELDTAPRLGQADGGQSRGTYLELGVAPGISEPDFDVAFPIKVGLSLDARVGRVLSNPAPWRVRKGPPFA